MIGVQIMMLRGKAYAVDTRVSLVAVSVFSRPYRRAQLRLKHMVAAILKYATKKVKFMVPRLRGIFAPNHN